MRQKLLILSLFIFAFLSSGLNIAKAQLLLEENFEYEDGAKLTDNGWNVVSSGGTNPIIVAPPSLTYSGYVNAFGNAALLNNNGESVSKQFSSPVGSGAAYASFLMKASSTNSGGGVPMLCSFWGAVLYSSLGKFYR